MNAEATKASLCFVFNNNTLLLFKNEETFTLPGFDQINALNQNLRCMNALGLINGSRCFCAEMDPEAPLPSNFQFFPLKEAFNRIEHQWFPSVAKSLHVIDWDKQNQFCGSCGKPTNKNQAIFEARCDPCNLVFYPRISPSIIVLIKKDQQILMARGPHFTKGVYGLIAGYVAPGETLEQTVEREVLEEVGIRIKNIRYFGSQPWPFPDALMIAFIADYDSGDLKIDNVEIVEADWYNVTNLPGLPSSSLSIARVLIDFFVREITQTNE